MSSYMPRFLQLKFWYSLIHISAINSLLFSLWHNKRFLLLFHWALFFEMLFFHFLVISTAVTSSLWKSEKLNLKEDGTQKTNSFQHLLFVFRLCPAGGDNSFGWQTISLAQFNFAGHSTVFVQSSDWPFHASHPYRKGFNERSFFTSTKKNK
jgi:hypothetical protein